MVSLVFGFRFGWFCRGLILGYVWGLWLRVVLFGLGFDIGFGFWYLGIRIAPYGVIVRG